MPVSPFHPTEDDMKYLSGEKKICCYDCASPYIRMSRMILCPICGNKRCPKATNHNFKCTGSNEPGQRHSRYE